MMAASKLRGCVRLWSPLAALRSLVTDGECVVFLFLLCARHVATARCTPPPPPPYCVSSHLHSLAASTPPPFQNNKQGARSEGALTGVRALALLHVIAQHAVILASARGSDFSSPALFSAAAAAGSAPRAEQQFFTSWLAQPVMAGDVGVDAFFVLSGCGGPFVCWGGDAAGCRCCCWLM
jgi:hypothetical protein